MEYGTSVSVGANIPPAINYICVIEKRKKKTGSVKNNMAVIQLISRRGESPKVRSTVIRPIRLLAIKWITL